MPPAEPGAAGITQPESRTHPHSSQDDPANDWLCAWCFNRVASEEDRFTIQGSSDFAFKNPEGTLFAIMTFSRTLGGRRQGVPTLDHTWFAAHAWSYCMCEDCGLHLGWYYTGPTEFAGLIRNRIVRALWVRN